MITKDSSAVDVLTAALQYAALGWSIIPIVADKKPSVRWKPFQSDRADEQQIRDWFDKRDDLGLAVVLGAVSGGLTCRDFDVEAAYHAWAAQNPELAKTLPTAKTARGFHVYFLSDLDHTVKFTDGELRGNGAYVVLPPSRHPSGVQYQWIIQPTSGIPKLNYQLFQSTEPTERQSMASVSPSLCVSGSPSLCLSVGSNDLDAMIAHCLPTKEAERNDKIFELARWLKADPDRKNAGSATLEPIVRKWHERALPVIGTKPFSETMADFENAWNSVKVPKGVDVVQLVWQKVRAETWPSEAEKYDSEDMRWLVALCLGLQVFHGPGRQFFLACRSAGNVLKRDHTDVAKWLKKFVSDGLLVAIPQPGRQSAHRYRYLGPSWNDRR
ncbi:MAG: bifunctional DNA primase/polymerase [Planctomycetia bacterium]|nr:bifunctional DNA primase/polymerase [Planctomycetia bacterium]